MVSMSRNYYDQPGGNGSVWNTPLGSGATWNTNANDPEVQDMRHGGIINASNYLGVTVWTGKATDPLRSFTMPNGSTIQIHVPAAAYSGGGGDNNMDLMDPVSHFGSLYHVDPTGAKITEVDNATSDSFGEDQETGLNGFDTAAGDINGYDLSQIAAGGHIQHMLRYATSAIYLMNDAIHDNTLGPNSWPQLKEDGQSGINVYTGHLPAGTTIGIPMSTPMPNGLSKGGQEIWWTLQHYGALFRDQAGGGIHFTANQTTDGSAIVNQMRTDLPKIVQYLAPLTNQHVGGTSFVSSPVNGPGSRVDAGPPPLAGTAPPPIMPSPDNTIVLAGSTAFITDAAGNKWTITGGAQVAVNGVIDQTTNRVTELAYEKGLVWQENTDKLWWSKSSPASPWGPTAAGTSVSPVPGPTTNPTGATITVQPAGGPSVMINGDTPGTTTAGGDTFVLTAPGVVKATLGASAGTILFAKTSQVSLTEGAGNTVIRAQAGNNTWTAGQGTLRVIGGTRQDSFVYHAGNGRLTVDDFSTAQGDTLSIDSSLKGSMKSASDGSGGTLLSFASGGGVDLKAITADPAGFIHWT
jgi:hypothetical protein